jgi:diguanylate cyclase (GGDEF)-like protein/PAS domain S-box-containing protein
VQAPLQAIFDSLPDAVVVTDARGTVLYANAALTRLLGHEVADVVGGSVDVLVPAAARSRHAAQREGFTRAPRVRAMGQALELHAERADGTQQAVDIAIAPVIGHPELFCAVVRDATVRHEHHRELRRQAEHDQLTGLRNRRGIEADFEDAMELAARRGTPLTLMGIDLDDFKAINDEHGHLGGDEVLATVGEVLRGRLRTTDIAARVGGDEFFVALPGTGYGEGLAVAEELRTAIVEATGGRASASFGVATFPDDGTIDEVYEAADRALYAAKDAGRNAVR